MNSDFWKNKKVLVTGHTGFKGTWLILLLKKLGAVVAGYALAAKPGSLFEKAEIDLAYQCEGDLRNQEQLLKFMGMVQPEIVLHLGSYGFIHESYQDPVTTFSTNTMGLVHLLEAVKKCATARAVVIVTSDKCYKNLETDIPYNEYNHLGAQDPYSASKACQELIAQSYFFSYFKNTIQAPFLATARASNVIGGGDDNKTRLIPYLIENFSNKTTAIIRNPDMIRPWQYVLDVLNGYLILAENLYAGKKNYAVPFNFGPVDANFVTVQYIVDSLAKKFEKVSYEITSSEVNKETKILKLDSSRAKKMLNWSQYYSLENTLELVADFKKRELQGEKIGTICQKQIELFLTEAYYD